MSGSSPLRRDARFQKTKHGQKFKRSARGTAKSKAALFVVGKVLKAVIPTIENECAIIENAVYIIVPVQHDGFIDKLPTFDSVHPHPPAIEVPGLYNGKGRRG